MPIIRGFHGAISKEKKLELRGLGWTGSYSLVLEMATRRHAGDGGPPQERRSTG